jgi:outer membrane protein assembly factor BamD
MRSRLAGLVGALLLAGCGAKDPDIATLSSRSDRVIWEAGSEAMENRHWENARQHFRRIIESFPQSEYGPPARLAMGDAYFREGGIANYILATAAYREFLRIFPSHARADYAQFQAAESVFAQKHSPDRDQSPTRSALEEYQRLLDLYPDSQYAETARARIQDCRQSLARAEFLAGYFYQRTRRVYRAAIARYEGLLEEYPDYERIDEVLFRLAQALFAQKRVAEALPRLGRLLEEFPDSEFADDAKELAETLERLLESGQPQG